MTYREQEEAEQQAYEAQMQAMYDEQCREQQLSEQVTWLQEEVARLKAENEVLRGERAAAVAEERTAVVAWLRGQQEAAEWALTAAGYEHAADAIERGEHCREEAT